MQPLKTCLSRLLVVSCVVAVFALCLAAKDFVKPAAQPAKTYPAHDDHTDEKVAIGADPYDTADKAKIFSINFHEHGLLPVFFVVTNDGDQPISVAQYAGDTNHGEPRQADTGSARRYLPPPHQSSTPTPPRRCRFPSHTRT